MLYLYLNDILVASTEDSTIISKNLSNDLSKGELSVEWDSDQGIYSFIILDFDAPYPYPHNSNSPFLHLLVVNVKQGDISTGNVLSSYVAPNPPADSEPHTYVGLLFLQHNIIDADKITQRKNFDLERFVSKYNLLLADKAQFVVDNGGVL